MKVWHLDSEYDAFIEAACSATEGRKAESEEWSIA